ncbi:MAG: sugar transferase, partial [Acidobacteria bacterium]|nr:sugar transferase [Acidobacteriota bacterium]
MIKRCLDLGVAGTLLLLSAPLMGVVALAILGTMGRPVVFRQQRPGLGGEPFYLNKFRTMAEATDASGRSLPDGERLTGMGRWLRSTSLDELPTLWNVLKGEMSLVGPR